MRAVMTMYQVSWRKVQALEIDRGNWRETQKVSWSRKSTFISRNKKNTPRMNSKVAGRIQLTEDKLQ
jgi:hypothetical protein